MDYEVGQQFRLSVRLSWPWTLAQDALMEIDPIPLSGIHSNALLAADQFRQLGSLRVVCPNGPGPSPLCPGCCSARQPAVAGVVSYPILGLPALAIPW